MDHDLNAHTLTRRGVLTLATGAGIASWGRLYASGGDFWNKKEPADWSSEEIDQLTTKSPWSKPVNAQMPTDQGGYGSQGGQGGQGGGMGGPRVGGIPGMGGGGMGGGGMGGGRRGRGGGQATESYKGTVRWESAKPIGEALKTPLPEAFANHYVISVSGFPLSTGRRRSQDDSDNTDNLDRLKSVTYLQPKDKRDLQPGVVQQQTSYSGSVLFGFSRELVTLKPEDKEVAFITQFGRLNVKAKFNLKEMLYRGELAV